MSDNSLRAGTPGKFGAWIRYGGDPISEEQLAFAAQNYAVAILQPWELDAARYLKEQSPNMVVLAYKCLSSSRAYEPGPIYSSGVSYKYAQDLLNTTGKDLFARRLDGSLIEWSGYWQHYQMAVWSADYRWQWVHSVVEELRNSPFDGVMADNDVENDYYGLNLPIQGVESITTIRQHLDFLISFAGIELNKIGKILVPNIAESRLRWGKWESHSAYGGGFEEVWLGWGAQEFLSGAYATMQGNHIGRGAEGLVTLNAVQDRSGDAYGAVNTQQSLPKVTILRTPHGYSTSPISGTDENLLYGLAGFWVFGGGRFTGINATQHDAYDGTPNAPELSFDLGAASGEIEAQDSVQTRAFTQGWAALNTGDRTTMVRVPQDQGLVDAQNNAAPATLTLEGHRGVIYRKR